MFKKCHLIIGQINVIIPILQIQGAKDLRADLHITQYNVLSVCLAILCVNKRQDLERREMWRVFLIFEKCIIRQIKDELEIKS